MSIIFKYSTLIVTFLVRNKVIQVFQTRYIDSRLRKMIYTINNLIFLFSNILTNFFLLIILIYQVCQSLSSNIKLSNKLIIYKYFIYITYI